MVKELKTTKEAKGNMTSNGNLKMLLERFQEGFGNSELLINDRFRNKYNDILIEFGY